MFLYQQSNTYFAQVAEGLQDLATQELESCGATAIKSAYRGLHFQADAPSLYAANYQARLVSRILAPLVSFACADRQALYRAAKSMAWERLFTTRQTFGVFANVSGNPQLRHSKFAALVLKDGIADRFREAAGQRPNVDKRHPDVWIQLHLEKGRATISLDTSGRSLHKRGYRRHSVPAPMIETLAAAMVALSGWRGDRPLADPMCGSGTLLCEAWMAASHIPAGYNNPTFGFRHLPDFDEAVWKRVKHQADDRIQPCARGLVSGSDIDRRAVSACRANCRNLPGGAGIILSRQDFRTISSLEDHVILCNPPYGIRLEADTQLAGFYKTLGDFLKQRCRGSEALIYFGNREMIKKIGLKPSWKKPVRNAGLDGRVVKYALY
jgi:putative N6-adenine-specific DNA methylase